MHFCEIDVVIVPISPVPFPALLLHLWSGVTSEKLATLAGDSGAAKGALTAHLQATGVEERLQVPRGDLRRLHEQWARHRLCVQVRTPY